MKRECREKLRLLWFCNKQYSLISVNILSVDRKVENWNSVIFFLQELCQFYRCFFRKSTERVCAVCSILPWYTSKCPASGNTKSSDLVSFFCVISAACSTYFAGHKVSFFLAINKTFGKLCSRGGTSICKTLS